jgi:UDP-N-acetylmuramoylalanine-D-glutamate ligase
MQLNLQIDDALLNEAVRLGGQQTPQALLLDALREYIQRRKRQAVLPGNEEARLAQKGGVWIAQVTATGDLETALEDQRAQRIAQLYAEKTE